MPASPDKKPLQETVSASQKDSYINVLISTGVPENDRPQYVKEVELFLRALRPSSLHNLLKEDVDTYLADLCERTDLKDDEVRRAIGALRLLLLQLTQTPAGRAIDWASWLERRHSTIPEQTAEQAENRERSLATGSPRIIRAAKTFPIIRDLSEAIQDRQCSVRTEQSYLDWCYRFLKFSDKQDQSTLDPSDVERFIKHLDVECKLAPKTQRLAYNAVSFLFKNVLEKQLEPASFEKQSLKDDQPAILTRNEVRALLKIISDTNGLMARILYGTGMRLMECVRLRVIDVDIEKRLISVRNSKGEKDRDLPLPQKITEPLERQIESVAAQHQEDLASGVGAVILPVEIAREWPDAARELGWQYLFPSGRLSRDSYSGQVGRTHIHPSSLQRSLRTAGEKADIKNGVNAQALRHAFAIHVLESGSDIRSLQALLGHTDIATTMRYTRVMNRGGGAPVSSPMDTI